MFVILKLTFVSTFDKCMDLLSLGISLGPLQTFDSKKTSWFEVMQYAWASDSSGFISNLSYRAEAWSNYY